jgi:multiple sugar transport system ATP-binding protein
LALVTMAAIDLINLTKNFGQVKAVSDLTLTISDKEFVALLGPSGCGKTTTMNMISGIESPTDGRICFNGVDIGQVPPGRRGIGFVFQNYAIFTHMTVRENLAFGLEIRRKPSAEIGHKVRDMAALMRLSDKLDRVAARLNVNEMQRLAIGRSAISHPEIFLLDEPLSNLDAAFRAEMRTELKHLQREIKQTMVYVTHDQIEAMSMADRIAVINLGVLQQYAPPLEIYNNPVNLFVAKFIGSPSMNLLACRLVMDGLSTKLDFGQAGTIEVTDPKLLAQSRHAQKQDLVFGARPEHLELRRVDAGAASLQMTATFVERVGARTIVHLERGDHVIKVAEKNGYQAERGDTLSVVITQGAPLLFDAESGRRLKEADR